MGTPAVLIGKQLLRYDDPGNIHYGYTGRAGKIDLDTLLFAAGVAQQGSLAKGLPWSDKVNHGDDARDQIMIRVGAGLYDKRNQK